ncbi:CHAT domain-containing protein [Cyclobacterium lianum]|uniref:CHAT domain-containing protein n=1 Tax=Cyclobacterium lianum TaxID=388280 RepID=A0A1M7QRJ9_9BACT|nr:CHAT domain-containing protein [Cyclobacterium lianum]SHN33918.1 CHAT domain-containing protein [Cyclobacterium lianum]
MKSLITLFGCLVILLEGAIAQDIDAELAAIQKALTEEDLSLAQARLDQATAYYLAREDFLNLSYFIPFAGTIAEARFGQQKGLEAARYWLDRIVKESDDPRDLRQAYLEIHTYFIKAGKPALAYEANETALTYTYQIADHRPAEWALIESNLGVIANQMGNPEKARKHTLKAKEGYEQDPETSPVNYFNLLNDLGARYWFSAMWDSAEYYWLEGIAYLDRMEPTPTNQYYRRAMIEGNLGAVYDVKGEVQESIRRVKSSISNTQYFIDNAPDDPKRDRAFLSLFHGSMNLALVYKSIGNYREALRLQLHTLKAKEEHFPAGHPEITESLIQVGQTYRFLDDREVAKDYLYKALRIIQEADGDFFMQQGDIHYTLALIQEDEKLISAAKNHYLQARQLFEKAYDKKFDFVYMDFLSNAANFFAGNNEPDLALEWARQGLDYMVQVNGVESMPGFLQTLNMGRVYFHLGDFRKAQEQAEKSLEILDKRMQLSASDIDAIRINYDKPQSILLQAQSEYALEKNRSITFLERTLERLLEAMTILEERKRFLSESEDRTILIAQNLDLINFVKKIQLELFEKTGDESYLDGLISVQESSVFNLIRTQLDLYQDIRFAGLPAETQAMEAELRQNLNGLLEAGGDLSEYHALSSDWQTFLENLEKNHPGYFKMRYASFPADSIKLPRELQVVRYFFVEERLKALVFANGKRKLFHLDFDKNLVNKLQENWTNIQELGKITTALYDQLWKPLASHLTQEQIFIVPAGVLFNLNFDLLTPQPPKDYRGFSGNSLLAKHSISYHYSLWMLTEQKTNRITARYVAFAPGFLDTMKEKYLNSLDGDSLNLDRSYLSLLPQPFAINLIERVADHFNGKTYLREQSTPEVFRENAGNHKIIHIASHAESNNISPGLSRIILAKTGKPEEENSIYAYEIYNTDLNANLTILTACETAKPVYKPGEGMISLAHAFQYSGSESLLTSLWRIDEKSSLEITDYFLALLAEGLPKDKALKEAKLNYLSQASGRTLSPQYWAGLVLIGSPEPIAELANTENLVIWLMGILVLILLSFLIFFKKKSHFS